MEMKKSGIDMLHGPIWNKIPLFALPVAATAILGQLFNASDLAVVGNFAGEARTAAVAAVGANSSVVSLVVNLFTGVALGANVVIAGAIGREDTDAAQRAVHTALLFAVIGGFVIALLGEFMAEPLLRMMSVPDEVLPLALLYLRIYLIGMPVILLYNFEAAIFRSIGDTKVPLATLAISGVINVILNLLFVIVLGMTVDGVAIATVISNAISAVILFFRLRKANDYIRLDMSKLRINMRSLRHILRIGLPAGVQSAVFSISNMVIQSAINSLGTTVMAASSAAWNMEVITFNILDSFSQACTTFVGQNYGAGQLERCKKTLLLSLLEGYIVLGIAVALILHFGHPLLALFNNDPEVIALGYTRMRLVLLAHVFSLLYNTMSGYLRGFGISLTPAALTMLGVCGIRILWVNTVFANVQTFHSVMMAYPISLAATALMIFIALIYYKPSRRFEPKTAAENG